MKIKNPHKYSVGRFKYIFDELYQRDLLISYYDLNIKLWNLNTMETLFNFEGYREIQTACFLNENKIIYVSIKLENCATVQTYHSFFFHLPVNEGNNLKVTMLKTTISVVSIFLLLHSFCLFSIPFLNNSSALFEFCFTPVPCL